MESPNVEILFWKVFHNKYLFSIILKEIHKCEWVNYVYLGYHVDNRKRFENITSMEWMINNEQFELLKLKINSNDEIIEINKKSIKELFSINDPSLIEQLLTQLFQSNKKNQFIKIINEMLPTLPIITSNSLRFKNTYNIFQLLLSNLSSLSSSFQIYSTLLECAIEFLQPNTLSILINSPNLFITQDFKNRSLTFTNLNSTSIKTIEEKIELILSNPKLYNTDYSNLDININFNGNGRERILKFIPKNENFGLSLILLINNSNIQNKLIDLNFHELNLTNLVDNKYKINEILLDYNRELRVKELHKYLLLNPTIVNLYDSIYLDHLVYYSRYGEIIPNLKENNLMDFIKISIATFNVKALKTISKQDLEQFKLKYSKPHSRETTIPLSISREYKSKQEMIEFINFYTTNYDYFQCFHFNHNKIIQDYILKNLSKTSSSSSSNIEIEYKELLNSINNIEFLNFFPNSWNELIKIIADSNSILLSVEIKDNLQIDWIFENCEKEFLKRSIRNFKSQEFFHFQNFQLLNYASNLFSSLPRDHYLYFNNNNNQDDDDYTQINSRMVLYSYPFIKSIRDCNIEQMKYLYSTKGDDFFLYGFNITIRLFAEKQFFFSSNLSDEEIINFIQYLNDNQFKFFKPNLVKRVIKSIPDRIKENELLKLKINFNDFIDEASHIFLKSIEKLSINQIKLMIGNGFFPIQDISSSLLIRYKDPIYSPLSKCAKFYSISNDNCEKVITLIQIFLQMYENYTKEEDDDNDNDQDYAFHIIINHLFKVLLSVKKVTIQVIKNIYNQISSSGSSSSKHIIIDHSLYHVVFYLSIKSPLLARYIMSRPFIYSIFTDDDDGTTPYYNCSDNPQHPGYDIRKYLNLHVFTFDFILGKDTDTHTSFDLILEKLIDALSYKPMTDDESLLFTEEDYLNETINSNLHYFLDIKREDLFLNHLDYIQNQFLNNRSLIVDTFPYMTRYQYHQPQHRQSFTNCNHCEHLNIQPVFMGRIFLFSKKLIVDSNKVLSNHAFKKLISFSSYQSFLELIMNENFKIIDKEITEILLKNADFIHHIFKIHYKSLIHNNTDNNNNDNSGYNEYWNRIIYKDCNNISIPMFIKFKHLFIGNDCLKPINDKDLELLFGQYCFDIDLRNLIINSIPNSNYFNITNSMISKAIDSNRIDYLKYLYENGGEIKNNPSLLQHLKNQLSKSYDYNCFLDWLN
ncbi:hypothetical protein DDB_G0274845 [Dictyostelium discoideum AX4]|uniref:Uncharacterized protein n=2 Tax=Dictyostelium discoideum TaxID=44689 RepID=Q555N1_DICDI|nr:hypothetical protein DDB_G0274845 [Dictyostelium discoideum AX4]EAL70315.1 hypothetical protein DDB_G0274845 [Dictyostelium discoideum AX4]|eukprot:XP_644035.1 hypothetical protein DDB_G0274845 [Dictyostelium discoideum AX4]